MLPSVELAMLMSSHKLPTDAMNIDVLTIIDDVTLHEGYLSFNGLNL